MVVQPGEAVASEPTRFFLRAWMPNSESTECVRTRDYICHESSLNSIQEHKNSFLNLIGGSQPHVTIKYGG